MPPPTKCFLMTLRPMEFNWQMGDISRPMKQFCQQVLTEARLILLRSGIGPKHELASHDIPIVAELPVGENLIDHPHYYNAYVANPDTIGRQIPVIGAKALDEILICPKRRTRSAYYAYAFVAFRSKPNKSGFCSCCGINQSAIKGNF